MLKRRRFWLGLFVSLVFLALFFYRIDLAQVLGAIKSANYLPLAPAVAVYFVAVWCRAVRWGYLLQPLGRIPSIRLFPVVVIGYMANDVLPVRMGELVRAYILGGREKISRTSTLGTIVAERTLDGLTLLLFLVAMSLFVPLADWLRDVARIMALLFVGAIALLLLVAYVPSIRAGLGNLVQRSFPGQLGRKISDLLSLFFEGLRALRSPWLTIKVFLSSILIWLLEASMYYIITFSFDLNQPFSVSLLVAAVANLAITLPSSQGGIGPFEFFSAQTLIFFGVAGALATAYAIVLHMVLLLPVILLGLFYLWFEELSLPAIFHEPKEGTLAQGYGAGPVPLKGRGDE